MKKDTATPSEKDTAASQAVQAVDEQPDGANAPRRITVRCGRPQGIWRAGRFWPSTPTTLPADALDKKQLAAVMAEPLLLVQEE